MYNRAKGSYELDDYLFQSRTSNYKGKQANRIYNQMSEAIGLKDIRTLMNVQKFCNHNNLRITLRYAGIEQGEIDTLTQNISI